MPPGFRIAQADLWVDADAQGWMNCTNAYACTPQGRGMALSEETLQRSVEGLRSHPTCLIYIAWDEASGEAAGIATCFRGWGTFAAKPLVNVHDLAVKTEFRGKGLGRALLDAVVARARLEGCCKVTLECLHDNVPARSLYDSSGFQSDMSFMELKLDDTKYHH